MKRQVDRLISKSIEGLLMNKKQCLFLAILTFLFCMKAEQHLTADGWDKRIYLATYPRSGNHWMRYLVEEITNIATSSVYRDADYPVHLTMPFPWGYCPAHGYEGIRRYPRKEDIVIIKTQFPAAPATQFDELSSLKAIRIIRHPVDSFYSYYLFLGNSPQSKISRENIDYFITTWRQFQEYWNQKPNVLTIRYEDLYNFPEETLTKVIEFIGCKVAASDIQRAVAKYPPKGGTMKFLKFFPDEDLLFIEQKLHDLLDQYNYKIPTSKS